MRVTALILLLVLGCAPSGEDITCGQRCSARSDQTDLGLVPGEPSTDLLGLTTTDLASGSANAVDLGQAAATDLRGNSCDPVPQAGCGAGEKCLPEGSAGTCVPLPVPASPTGATCAGPSNDGCAAGEICIKETTSTIAVCHQLCRADADCTGATLAGAPKPACNIIFGGSTTWACSPSCNPVGAAVGAAGCGPGLTCAVEIVQLDSVHTGLGVDCISPGKGAIGASCFEAGDCIPGAMCASGTCQKACHLGGQGECSGSQSCIGFSGLGKPSPFGACG